MKWIRMRKKEENKKEDKKNKNIWKLKRWRKGNKEKKKGRSGNV